MSSRARTRLRLPAWLRKSDAGSGTMMGVMLVAVAAIGLAVVAITGNILVCQSRARTAADASALAAASAVDEGSPSACVQAATVASANKGELVSCTLIEQDVQVRVQVATQVPFAAQVTAQSRAGPQDCS
ncbi:hypothetical protein KIMH_14570 [Bombiscardovia apis]|uniref:Putative Flp pilus-assembly TadG-like N-terminal domain-containing protein n=1 Tax=Bombiscardovia apis TaxID=2932182 RepID=A0ABM8BEI5_9BIFI|nr:Rv3654c family TadE-like protein [Bombiscardovia apis]BDR55346.1 hypothetical protein KIMH_14570 [Bombiscardovia apis]